MTGDRHGRTPATSLVLVGLLTLLAAATSAWTLGLWHPVAAVDGDSVSVLTALVSLACCVWAAYTKTGWMRRAWALFAVLMAMNAVGDYLRLAAQGGPADAGGIIVADVLYAWAIVPTIAALAVYPVLRDIRASWRPILLDAVVLSAALLYLSHVLVLRTVFDVEESGLARLKLMFYPVADVLFASLALLLLLRSIGQPRLDVVLVGATFAVYTVADNGYAVLSIQGRGTAGTFVDVALTVAPLVLASAAVLAATTPTPRRTLKRHLSGVLAPLLPDLTALLALAVAIATGADDTLSTALGVVTLVAVGVRQVAQTHSGQELSVQLQRRVAERTLELADLTAQYHRLDAMKYEFVTTVSHELRTPLSAIRGSLEMLHDGDVGTLPPHARKVVAIASRGSERLSRLVNDIIDLERLESGGFGFSPAMHEVSGIVAEATQSLLPLAREHRVEISVRAAPGQAWCDADRVVQVLVNLLGNALKFTPTDTTVTITAARHGGEFVISVRDEGRGIPEADLAAVFDRFHQIEVDDSREKGGAGLGLTICQRIVDKHGGRIWAESPSSGGARFTFTLPAVEQAPDERQPRPEGAGSPPATHRGSGESASVSGHRTTPAHR